MDYLTKLRETADSVGIILHSSSYINSITKYEFECRIHGKFLMSYSKFMGRKRCPTCGYTAGYDKCKSTLEQVKSLLEPHGYTLMTPYINSSTKSIINCPIHGNFNMSIGKIKGGQRCPKCSRTIAAMRCALSYDEASYGAQLSGHQYVRYDIGIGHLIRCPVHGEKYYNSTQLRDAIKCEECVRLELVKSRITDNCTLNMSLIIRYKPLQILCPTHGAFEVPYSRMLNRNIKCATCEKGSTNIQLEHIRNTKMKAMVEKYGFKFTPRDYIGHSDLYTITCAKHGEFTRSFHSFAACPTCPSCRGSIGEVQCREILERLTNRKFPNTKSIFKSWPRLEIDCYNGDLKLGLEFQGEQHYTAVWNHTISKVRECQRRDAMKAELAKLAGIYLIIVPYYIKPSDREQFIIDQLPMPIS